MCVCVCGGGGGGGGVGDGRTGIWLVVGCLFVLLMLFVWFKSEVMLNQHLTDCTCQLP